MSNCACCGGASIEHAFVGDEVPPLAGAVVEALAPFLATQANLNSQIHAVQNALHDTNSASILHELQILERKKADSIHNFVKIYTENQPYASMRELTPFKQGDTKGVEAVGIQHALTKRTSAPTASVVSDPDCAPWSVV